METKKTTTKKTTTKELLATTFTFKCVTSIAPYESIATEATFENLTLEKAEQMATEHCHRMRQNFSQNVERMPVSEVAQNEQPQTPQTPQTPASSKGFDTAKTAIQGAHNPVALSEIVERVKVSKKLTSEEKKNLLGIAEMREKEITNN